MNFFMAKYRKRDSLLSVCAEIPGTVLCFYVDPGAGVAAGQPLAMLESMKMEIPVLSEAAGTVVALSVDVGSSVLAGDVVATIQLNHE